MQPSKQRAYIFARNNFSQEDGNQTKHKPQNRIHCRDNILGKEQLWILLYDRFNMDTLKWTVERVECGMHM